MAYCARATSNRKSKETTTTPPRKPPPPADTHTHTHTHGVESSLANHSGYREKQAKRKPQRYTAHPATAQGRSTAAERVVGTQDFWVFRLRMPS